MVSSDFQRTCCSLDLETNEDGIIYAVGAVLDGRTFLRKAPFNIHQVLAELDDFISSADFLLGHNILRHDLPVCKAITTDLALLSKPAIDTLFLSPLAFPENPYHRLVKDYKLVRDSLNEPLTDARLALVLFAEQQQALSAQQQQDDLLSFYHFAFAGDKQYSGLLGTFKHLSASILATDDALTLFKQRTIDRVCIVAVDRVLEQCRSEPSQRPALAYALAWLRVAGGNSVLPPWVRLEFADIAPLLRQLRDIPCSNSDCSYCARTHNPIDRLQCFFGFPAFRAEPAAADGTSLQQLIVTAALCDMPIFAILPTGGGKSLCFQLPALVRYQRRGVLTIVISPLQALMKDQVDNLRNKTGAPNTAALYGLLTPPERGQVLTAIQMGDIAVLYVSPEQLRNHSFQQAISHREIGCWVFDEAHCLSKWGHDFRPDYLYAARFIKEHALKQRSEIPPIQCFTATAKLDVKDEIIDYFRSNLAQELSVFEGGVERDNLAFEVQTINQADKYPRINTLLTERLDKDVNGGSAIIYCSTRKNTEAIADYLGQQGWQVEAFHAGKDAAEKKHIQENFINSATRIITATNAFGMGIDKDDVRLVIHADIPGSLENYLQEAGRAGRDQKDAECILLYDQQDIENQFKLSASSNLTQHDIAQILRGLRRTKKDRNGNVVITAGELLQDDLVETTFSNEDNNANTKVVTAISWLERAGYVERNENRTQVFQGKPLVKDIASAEEKIAKLNLSERQSERWLAILQALFNADSNESFSADELALQSAFASDTLEVDKPGETASQRVIRTLYDMTEQGMIQQSLMLSAYVRHRVANSSLKLLQRICHLERHFIEVLQEQAPDADSDDWQNLSLRHLSQRLLDDGLADSNPEILRLLLSSLSRDGQGLAASVGSISLRHRGQDQYAVRLNRSWQALTETMRLRQALAQTVLACICLQISPETKPSADILVEFSSTDLLAALKQDMDISARVKDPLAAVERALNFLHEQKIITLQQGLAVFRQAMTIEVLPEAKGRHYNKGDYQPLSQHYSERVFQVHVINEYARQALDKIGHALALVVAYFTQDKTEFVKRYFADRQEILERATSQQSFQRIVNDLRNPEQMALVAGREDQNLLILAGPGSGKTRVVVHRCAYLLRVKRVPSDSLLVLCFNRSAALEVRKRLHDLVGDDARGVAIQTYHGLSLRLTGHSLSGSYASGFSSEQLEAVIGEATELLNGNKSILGLDPDQSRDRLLAGYRFILVDEYQDIDAGQYQLISALAGRSLEADQQLSILAVGDDDQNIYQFRGANVEFIKKFGEDYQAKQQFLVENYRSSGHIIAASNALIANNRDRMKTQQPIRINRERATLDPGGRWFQLDTLTKGRVQILTSADEYSQAAIVVAELQRLRQLDNRLVWSQCAVLAREWRLLDSVRTLLEEAEIPFDLALPSDRQPTLTRVREIADLLDAIRQSSPALSKAGDWLNYLQQQYGRSPINRWVHLVRIMLEDWQRETGNGEVTAQQSLDYLYESLAEKRRNNSLGLGVLLSTVHSVKGMEFTHVIILDGGWANQALEEDRRLYYVAMTRAKETLALIQRQDCRSTFLREINGDSILGRIPKSANSSVSPVIKKRYHLLSLRDIDLSYAASRPLSNLIHRTFRSAVPGKPINNRR